MKLYAWIFTILILIGSGFYWNETHKPCESPLFYTIGTIDKEHGLSKEDFINLLKKAEGVWEEPLGKNLFEYKENAQLTVNLRFDERQAELLRLAEKETN